MSKYTTSLSSERLNRAVYNPFQVALGDREFTRVIKQFDYYKYYEGYQHKDPMTGQLTRGRDLTKPLDMDYKPTRYTTNLLKSFVQRKSRWQFGAKPNVVVTPKTIDSYEQRTSETYEPSKSQLAENKRASDYETLLMQIWNDNKMHEKLLKASRDRIICGRVACKIAFNDKTGKIHWVFKPDYETFPIFSDDDLETLEGLVFVEQRVSNSGEVQYKRERYSLQNGNCRLEIHMLNDELEVIETIVDGKLYIDFIPVVLFPLEDLVGNGEMNIEFESLKELQDIVNQLNEDSIDSLRFEMFSTNIFANVDPNLQEQIQVVPNGSIFLNGGMDSTTEPKAYKLEGKFGYTNALSEQYARVKTGMHEISNLPAYSVDQLNFGGVNNVSLQILFHNIITDTEENWVIWNNRLQELHEKTIKFLQSRNKLGVFIGYDKDIVNNVGSDYSNEVIFKLPLPESRRDLVDLLAVETINGFESIEGAMQRLGVDDVDIKKSQIKSERKKDMELTDIYAMEGGQMEIPKANTSSRKKKSDKSALH